MKESKNPLKLFLSYYLYMNQNLTKKESVFSIFVFLLYCFIMSFVNNLGEINILGISFSRPIPALCCSILLFLLLCFGKRKKLSTIGVTTGDKKSALVLLVIMLTVALQYILAGKVTLIAFFGNAVFYFLLFFFSEEFIFRGYLWPRFMKMLGLHVGTILCGSLYGLMMLTNPGNYETLSFLTIVNTLFAGIILQYIFSFLYLKQGNLYFSAILHAGFYLFSLSTIKW